MAQAFSVSPDAVRAYEPSHSATVDDDFTRLYGNYETNEPEDDVASTERKVFDKMGVFPRHCQSPIRPGDPYLRDDPYFSELVVSANGRIEGGLYPPSFYEYEDDLLSGTWEAGLDAINAFDWDQTPSEKQNRDTQDSGNGSDSISIVGTVEREVSPPDSLFLDAPPDAQSALDNARDEPADEHNQNATSDSNAPQMVSLASYEPPDRSIALPLPPSAPSPAYHQASDYSNPSPPWIESPPPDLNLVSEAQIDTVPFTPTIEDPLPGTTDSPLTSQVSPGDLAGPDSGMIVDSPLNNEDTYMAEGNAESSVQPDESETMHGLPSPAHNQTTASSDTATHDGNLGQQERAESSSGEGVIITPSRTTSPRAKESLSDDVASLSNDNGDTQEDSQPHDASANVMPGLAVTASSSTTTEDEDPQPPTPQPIGLPIADSTAEPGADVGNNDNPVPEQAIEEALPSESLDMHPLEQTTSHAHLDAEHVSLVEPGSQDGVAAEIVDFSSPAAPSVPDVTHVASPHENVQPDFTEVLVGRQDEPMPSVEAEAPATSPRVEVQISPDIMSQPKDASQPPEDEESGVLHGPEQATPTEPSAPCSVHETSDTSIKLKIGSGLWNDASLQMQQVENDDTIAGDSNTPGLPPLGLKHPDNDIVDIKDSRGIQSGGPANSASPFDAEVSRMKSEEQTPQPLLAGLEEAAAGADVTPLTTPKLVPTTWEHTGEDGGSQWPGDLLEQHLELPPSPFPTKAFVMADLDEMKSAAKIDGGEEGSEAAASDAQDVPLPVSKQDARTDLAEHDTAVEHATSGPSAPVDTGALEVKQHDTSSVATHSDTGTPEAEPHATSGPLTPGDIGAPGVPEVEQRPISGPSMPGDIGARKVEQHATPSILSDTEAPGAEPHATLGPSKPGDIGTSEVEQHASSFISSDKGASQAEQHAASGASTPTNTGAPEAEEDPLPTPTTAFKKRKRPTTAKSKAKRDPSLAFSPDEVSGSEYDVPVKKKQKKSAPKKAAAKSAGFQVPTVASGGKRDPSPVVAPKKQPSMRAASRPTKQGKKGEKGGGKEDVEDAVQKQIKHEDQPGSLNRGTSLTPAPVPNRSSRSTREPSYGKRETRGEVKKRLVDVERAKLEEALANTDHAQGAIHAKKEEEALAEVDDDKVPAPESKATGNVKPKPKPKNPTAATKPKPATTTTSGAPTRTPRSKTPAEPSTSGPPTRTTRSKTPAEPSTGLGPLTRSTRSKTPASSTTPTEPSTTSTLPLDAAITKNKPTAKPSATARKRKATEYIDVAETSQSEGRQTKRQTRQMLAAQEEQQRREEVEKNVGKRTRSAVGRQ